MVQNHNLPVFNFSEVDFNRIFGEENQNRRVATRWKHSDDRFSHFKTRPL